MKEFTKPVLGLSEVRVDFVPKEDYISSDVAKLEAERLWFRVWQVACREEEIASPGSYVTYNIVDQSVIVLRTPDNAIKAFYNACPHRGRELTEGCGSMTKVHCRFHGWQWDLDGRIQRVPDRGDWDGYPGMDDGSLHLKEIRVGKRCASLGARASSCKQIGRWRLKPSWKAIMWQRRILKRCQ
jgi:phenylpropionate dioxygenase-like ring-hydroxylating dioxygenase large terminal subunit